MRSFSRRSQVSVHSQEDTHEYKAVGGIHRFTYRVEWGAEEAGWLELRGVLWSKGGGETQAKDIFMTLCDRSVYPLTASTRKLISKLPRFGFLGRTRPLSPLSCENTLLDLGFAFIAPGS